jgi:hypothetical protein
MVGVGWRLFSLSVLAARLGVQTSWVQTAWAQVSFPCVNDASNPYQLGVRFAPSRTAATGDRRRALPSPPTA